jgi:serine protease inhibitor
MCTVNIKVDDALVRRINPGLSSRESINKWLQGQVNAMIEEMAAEDTVDLETAREMLHQTIREVYAEP